MTPEGEMITMSVLVMKGGVVPPLFLYMALQARTEFAAALNQLASEKGVDVNIVIEAIQQAALAAYRKDLSLRNEPIPEDFDTLIAQIDPISGEISILRGDKNITPPGFARIAAQTAKQVIMQRLNEAEKGAIMDEYAKKVGTVISGRVQRQEGNTFFIDIGRAEGVLPPSEQIHDEYLHLEQRLKVFIKEIREGRRGPEVIVSRVESGLIKGLFGMEVPEIQTGSVVVKDIAREAGSRTKISVASTQEGVDPVGSMVGQKGVRVQAVMNDLGEEKIDIIAYSDDPARYIAAALSPAKDVVVILDEKEKVAKVKVVESQLSLAIGRGGQNVRLAAKLTGWKIDIEGKGEVEGGAAKKEGLRGSLEETPQEIIEDVQKDIDKATLEEAGEIESEPEIVESSPAVKGAKEDISKTEDLAQEKDPELGSFGESEDAKRGDLVGMHVPTEDQSPTVANTSDTPDVSSAEPPFPENIGPTEIEKEEESSGDDDKKK